MLTSYHRVSSAAVFVLLALVALAWPPTAAIARAAQAADSLGNAQLIAKADLAPHRVGAGRRWTLQATPSPHTLRSVIYAANQYVVVGESGLVLTSPEGINWTVREAESAQ